MPLFVCCYCPLRVILIAVRLLTDPAAAFADYTPPGD